MQTSRKLYRWAHLPAFAKHIQEVKADGTPKWRIPVFTGTVLKHWLDHRRAHWERLKYWQSPAPIVIRSPNPDLMAEPVVTVKEMEREQAH